MSGPNPSGLCMCGCGERTARAPKTSKRRGNIRGKPQRYIRAHQNLKSPVEYIEQDCGYDTPCWVWQRAISSEGYGCIRVGGRLCYAPRVYYEREHGPIPQGLEPDHLCRTRACVRPSHLEPVTRAENMRRAAAFKKASMDPEDCGGPYDMGDLVDAAEMLMEDR